MTFNEYDIVRVINSPYKEIANGRVGAVIVVFDFPKEAYEVEFQDNDEGFVQYTFYPEDIELVES